MRRLWRAGPIGGFALIAACGGDGATTVVPVKSIRFTTVPTSVIAGATFDLTVELLAADGTRASGASDQVALTLSDGSGITGPSSVRASNGVATFTKIAFTRVAAGIYLSATAGGHVATTDIFSVTPAAANGTHSSVTSAVSVVPTEATPIVFTFKDAYDNVLPGATVSVSAVPGAVFTPGNGTTTAAGTFATVLRTPVGGAVPVSATVNGTPIALANPLQACTLATLALPASATGALNATSCPISGRPTALFKFTAGNAGAVTFAVTSAFTPRVEVKADPPLSNVYATPVLGLVSEWLLPTGTYQLRVGATSGTGTFSVSGSASAGNSGCVKRYLTTAGTYGGQALATGDCDYGDGTFADKYVVYSPNPCGFEVHTTKFTPFIFLMELGTGHFLDGRVDFPLGMPSCSYLGGPVEIWVLPDEGEAGGAYTLTYTLYDIPPPRISASVREPAPPEIAARIGAMRRFRAMLSGAR